MEFHFLNLEDIQKVIYFPQNKVSPIIDHLPKVIPFSLLLFRANEGE